MMLLENAEFICNRLPSCLVYNTVTVIDLPSRNFSSFLICFFLIYFLKCSFFNAPSSGGFSSNDALRAMLFQWHPLRGFLSNGARTFSEESSLKILSQKRPIA